MKYIALFSFVVACASVLADDAPASTPTAVVAAPEDNSGFQFGKQNSFRLRFGGGTPIAFGDLLAGSGNDRHGDRFSALTGSFQLTTVLYEAKSFTLDAGFGPEFTGAIDGKDGTSFGVGLDVRALYTGLRTSECPLLSKLQPFLSVGTGVNYMDVNFRDGGTKIGLPLKAGAGFRYLLGERWAATLEYSLYHMTGAGENFFDYGHTSHGSSTDMFLLGFEYKF